jgi:hypothetical protein
MRRAIVIGVVLLAIVATVGIGIAAYNAGVSEGVSEGLRRAGDSGQAVRAVGPRFGHGYGYGYGWGFPFGLILFPLLVIGIILLVRGLFWRGRWGGPGGYGPGGYGWGPPGPWGQGGPQRFEEWHRRQHDQPGEQPGAQPGDRTPEQTTDQRSTGGEPTGA